MTISAKTKLFSICLASLAFWVAVLLALPAQAGITRALVIALAAIVFVVLATLGFRTNTRIAHHADRQRLALFPERNPNPVLSLSAGGQVVYANTSAVELLKELGEDGRNTAALLPPDLQLRLAALRDSVNDRQTWEYTAGERFLACNVHFLRDRGEFYVYIMDITRYRRAEAELLHQAHHDTLTGLPNRRQFHEHIEQALAVRVPGGMRAALLLMDIDRFNVITRSLGHGVSDGVLQAVTARLEHLLAEERDIFAGATLYRFEADVFAILIPGFSARQTPVRLAERIISVIQHPLYVNTREFFVTFSLGISEYPIDGQNSVSLLRNADTAMQRAKQLGGNNIQPYSQEMNARAAESLSLENYLRHAIEHEELSLHYQPEIDIRSGCIAGAEVLLRWKHPDRGIIMPTEFIPLAEETGTIVPIGEWTLHAACTQRKAWHDAGLTQLTVAVNISARQFHQHDLSRLVSHVLSETGIDPGMLELEITEGVAMQDVEYTCTTLKQLKDIGVHLSIDDFGTGFSSLSYLRRFPIDKLKIDQSFVRNLTTNENDAAITRAIIGLGHSMKLMVIAEGVETTEQLSSLRQEGCDMAQGFYLHRPLTASGLEEVLRHDHRLRNV